MAKYKAPTPEPEGPPKRKTVVPGWARKYQREQEESVVVHVDTAEEAFDILRDISRRSHEDD